MSPLPLPSLTRRATIAGVLAAAASLAGCDAGDGPSSAATSGGTPPTTDGATTPAATTDAEIDDALVDATAERIATQLALLGAVTDSAHQLRPPLSMLTRMHHAHAVQLPEVAPVEPPRVGRDPQGLWTRVRATEAQLVRDLARAAEDARSGTLARLFASMSAGTAAHLAALPEGPPTRQGGTA